MLESEGANRRGCIGNALRSIRQDHVNPIEVVVVAEEEEALVHMMLHTEPLYGALADKSDHRASCCYSHRIQGSSKAYRHHYHCSRSTHRVWLSTGEYRS